MRDVNIRAVTKVSRRGEISRAAHAVCGVLAVLAATSSVAQPSSGNTKAASTSARISIEEVVVTAQKRESSLQDAPMSISAMGSEDMAFRGVSNVTDLQSQVPGLSVSESGGASLITIRGVGMNVDSGAVEPGVAVHIDGVYQPRPSTGPLGFSDLERVEVLRGPQGTLYGRNSTGGVINFILKRPSDEFESSVRLGASSFERHKAVGSISGPLVDDHLFGRLVMEWDDEGGYVKDVISGQMSDDRRGHGLRGALTGVFGDALTVDLSVLYRHDSGAGLTPRDVTRIAPDPNKEVSALFFLPTDTTQADQVIVGEPWKRKLNRLGEAERTTTNGALSITWEGDSWNLKSVTGAQDHEYGLVYDPDFTSDEIYIATGPGLGGASRSVSEELVFSIDTGDLQWLFGAYYFVEDYEPILSLAVPKAFFGSGVYLTLGSHEETTALAAFTDLTYALSDRVRVTAGLRVLEDEKTAVQFNRFRLGADDGIPIFTVPGVITACEDEEVAVSGDKITPKLGLQWELADGVDTYVQYALGYKSGGTNFSACGDTYEPEEVEAVEIGLKSRWFDGRVIANMSVFDSKYSNFQVLRIDGLSGTIVNAPKARISGGDLELKALITAPVLLTAAVSVLDARYEEFTDSDPANPENGDQDMAGSELSRAPDYTVNIGAEYSWEMPFDVAHDWRLRAEWYKTADLVYRPYGGPEDGQASYTLVNAYLSTTDVEQALQLRWFAKNLQNTRYYLHATGDSTGRIYGPAGEPRSFGFEFSYNFR
jgi:iron complex outermembrane receptor protein